MRRGQPLGTAHKLVPEAAFLTPRPAAYRAAMEAALEALAGFTPAIEGATDPESPAFGRVLLGIEGLARLWGDEPTLTARVVARVAAVLPGSPRAGIAGTRFGAAVAAATSDAPPRPGIVPDGPGAEAAFLAPLPVSLLPADEALRARFRLFGLERMGDLARLPRSAVATRFGAAGGELHDLAGGLDGRPLVPRRPVERLCAEAELVRRSRLSSRCGSCCTTWRPPSASSSRPMAPARHAPSCGWTWNAGSRSSWSSICPSRWPSRNSWSGSWWPAWRPSRRTVRWSAWHSSWTAGVPPRRPSLGLFHAPGGARRSPGLAAGGPGHPLRPRPPVAGQRERPGEPAAGGPRGGGRPRPCHDPPARPAPRHRRRPGRLGRPACLRWEGTREPVEVCNQWRIEEAWWRRPIRRAYFKLVGPRLLALVYRDEVDGAWHLERLYD